MPPSSHHVAPPLGLGPPGLPRCPSPPDPHPRGLERRPVQRHGLHLLLGRPLLRGPDDLWQLRALQPTGGHPGGGLPGGGEGDFQEVGASTLWGLLHRLAGEASVLTSSAGPSSRPPPRQPCLPMGGSTRGCLAQMAPTQGSLTHAFCSAGHRAMPADLTQTKIRHPPTWRRILTSSETSEPQVCVGMMGTGLGRG